MANLEQVEKLREKANVSYDDAKNALDATNGDLLEALIYLEKQGKVAPPSGGGYYNTEKSENKADDQTFKGNPEYTCKHESFADMIRKFGRFCAKVIQKGNTNSFEVSKDNQVKTLIPVTVLVLLVIFMFWVTIPLLIIGLFFGFRYHFRGPDLDNNAVNNAMNNVANAAESIKKSVNGENK